MIVKVAKKVKVHKITRREAARRWRMQLHSMIDRMDTELLYDAYSYIRFLTDLLDVHGDCGNITDGIHIPDFPEQFFLGIHMVGIFREKSQ